MGVQLMLYLICLHDHQIQDLMPLVKSIAAGFHIKLFHLLTKHTYRRHLPTILSKNKKRVWWFEWKWVYGRKESDIICMCILILLSVSLLKELCHWVGL